jgi:hypothetical protein
VGGYHHQLVVHVVHEKYQENLQNPNLNAEKRLEVKRQKEITAKEKYHQKKNKYIVYINEV